MTTRRSRGERDDLDQRAERLLRQVLASADPEATQELVSSFSNGFPAERLAELFQSENPAVVGCAAYIASEIPAGSMVEHFPAALASSLSWVRSAGIDCVWRCGVTDGKLLAQALALLLDENVYTRGVAQLYLPWASTGQLTAALEYIQSDALRDALWWLATEGSRREVEILLRVQSSNALTRKVALAAAARTPDNGKTRASLRAIEVAATMHEDPELKARAKRLLDEDN